MKTNKLHKKIKTFVFFSAEVQVDLLDKLKETVTVNGSQQLTS